MSGFNLPTVAGSLDDIGRALHHGLHLPGHWAYEPGPTEHGLQTAAALRRSDPVDVELHVAGLVHDLGRVLTSDDGPSDHARAGARFVALVLGPRVAALVERHVLAGRYLATVDVTYRQRLTTAGSGRLERAGGTLSPAEVSAFVAFDDWRSAVALRRAEDAARDPALDAGTLADWSDALVAVATRERRAWV
jgi:gamma-butyrobetaine dioxygenase